MSTEDRLNAIRGYKAWLREVFCSSIGNWCYQQHSQQFEHLWRGQTERSDNAKPAWRRPASQWITRADRRWKRPYSCYERIRGVWNLTLLESSIWGILISGGSKCTSQSERDGVWPAEGGGATEGEARTSGGVIGCARASQGYECNLWVHAECIFRASKDYLVTQLPVLIYAGTYFLWR